MSDVKVKDLYWCKADYIYKMFDKEYPWQILPEISETIKVLIISGIYGFERYSDGILVGKNVKISKTATIIAPAIIGNNTVIRPCAYIRGNAIIGDNCIIGNSTEIKNFTLDKSNFLLLELDLNDITDDVINNIEEIRWQLGLIPIIAHIERYHKLKGFKNLKKNGKFLLKIVF